MLHHLSRRFRGLSHAPERLTVDEEETHSPDKAASQHDTETHSQEEMGQASPLQADAQSLIPFFRLPLEIRRQIYRELLSSSTPIPGGELVEEFAHALVINDSKPRPNIDARILRTSRQIYEEALPVLYQNNRFIFSDVNLLETFRSAGLALTKSPQNQFCKVPMFDFTHNTDGRLSLVRNVTIRFPDESAQTSYSRTGLEERSRGEGEWAKFLHEQRTQETVSYPHTKGYLSFPALEDLILDFSAWHLEENEKVNTGPFVYRFASGQGLKCLTLVGVANESTIRRFKEGLVSASGKLVILDRDAF